MHLVQHPRRTVKEATIYDPVLCLILQGRKEVVFADRSARVGAGQYLLVSHDLPVVARVIEAPYLALLLSLRVDVLRALHAEIAEPARVEGAPQALGVHDADARLLDAVGRYASLAASAVDAAVLGPMVLREIHYLMLTGPLGPMLRDLARQESRGALVARAIGLLRSEFRSPVGVDALAASAGMSASAFHRHFKAVTSLSPLQYQKELRLLEARRLLRGGAASVSAAAFAVGYESPSQFSREYTRRFGTAPRTDRMHVARLARSTTAEERLSPAGGSRGR
jgi:AraC-like DNA-binding protein